jgi:hypothetical protein
MSEMANSDLEKYAKALDRYFLSFCIGREPNLNLCYH